MSWFYHVNHGSPQQAPDLPPGPAEGLSEGGPFPRMRGPSLDNRSGAPWFGAPFPNMRGPSVDARSPPGWLSSTPPVLADLPSPPQGSGAPPSLEALSCTSPHAGGAAPLSYVTLQEQRCVLSWFLGWGATQRERFLQDLLGKAVPGKVCTLLDSLNTLQVIDRPPNIFECQLRLWSQWFESWSEEERNGFLHILEERDPMFVAHFYRGVAGTAGRD